MAPGAVVEETVQSSTVTPAEPVSVEKVERHAQRREERRTAKTQKDQRGVVSKVTDNQRISGLRKFYHDTMSEIRKVVWPDRTQTRNLTLVVIAMSVAMGALLGTIDFVLLKLFETIG